MKNILFFIMTILFVGCGKEDISEAPMDIFDSDKSEKENVLSFKIKELTLTSKELSAYVSINSNIDYRVKIEGDNKDWIKYELRANESIFFEAKPNNTEIERSIKCIIYNDELKLSDTLSVKQSVNKERLALIKIYNALNGVQWTNCENWCSDKPLSEWEGVMANGDAEVYRLWLSHDAYVKGEIPDCIGDLIYLENISFEYSNVSGKIPETIGNLIRLKRITVSNCRLEGNIPKSIANCKQLEYVDMSKNFFTGEIPESFFQCEKLSDLMLHDNKFSKFLISKDPISNKLHTLYISDNEISSSIPDKLFLCKSLRFINAENNKIIGNIPNTIRLALNLKVIDLGNNEIEGELPSEIGVDSKLENITVPNNRLSGKVPECYTYLNLVVFDVRNNYLDIEGCDYIKNNLNYQDWLLLPQNRR